MTSNGVTESQVVGFQPVNPNGGTTVFTDTISTINNRVMSYKVKAVDQFLNYSNEKEAGHDDPDSGYDEKNPGSVTAKTEHTIDRIIDNKADSVYNGKASEGAAEIIIDMHDIKEVTSLKYSGTNVLNSGNAKIYVSTDGSNWTTVSTWTKINPAGSAQMVWFDSVKADENNKWIGTYDARYVKLAITGLPEVSINEIDVCGPTGDNIEFHKTESGTPSIGLLSAEFKYGDKAEDVIPAGSLIFTGVYKGYTM